MDKNLAAFLDPAAYTIAVNFQKTDGSFAGKDYHYVTNIPNLKVGDWVVVNTNVGGSTIPLNVPVDMQDVEDVLKLPADYLVLYGMLNVVRVTEVHTEVAIQPASDKEYRWVIAKVELEQFVATAQRNKQITALATAAYTRNLRRSFADRIMGDMSLEDRAQLQNLLGNSSTVKDSSNES